MRLVSSVRNVDRMRHITEVAVRHGFGYFFERHRLRNVLPRRLRPEAPPPGARGEHIREMLQELGPTFVKFGQLLSTRPDLLPPDIIVELRRLQDDVPSFPVELAWRTIEDELGLTVEQLFLEFEDEPIAAASIGQVHRAVLPNGERVIVKVQRPDARQQVQSDIDLLYQVARLLRDHSRQQLFLDPVGMVDEFARGIRGELEYRSEAHNAERFSELFADDAEVVIPRVYWQYTTNRVLTLEYLEGTQVVDVDPDAVPIAERKALATAIANAWLKQIFIHGYFHGDPHPANILVLEDGAIGLVDFGIAGRLPPRDRQNIIALFIDVMQERIESMPRRLADLGVEFPREKEADFVSEARELFSRYFGARLDEINAVDVLRDIFDAIHRLQLKLPAQYLLLEKTVATLEGIGVQLYPPFNVFEVARPFAREFMMKRYSPEFLLKTGAGEAREYARVLAEYPHQLADILEEMRRGDMKINFVHRNLEDTMRSLAAISNRLVMAVVLSSLILGSSIIGLFAQEGPRLVGISVFALAGFMVSGFFGFWLLVDILRSGRR